MACEGVVGDRGCPWVHLALLGVPTVIKRGPFQGPVGENGARGCPWVHLALLGVPTVIERGPFQGPVYPRLSRGDPFRVLERMMSLKGTTLGSRGYMKRSVMHPRIDHIDKIKKRKVPERDSSLFDESFFVVDAILLEKLHIFIFETDLLMMLFLPQYIIVYGLLLTLADGENSIRGSPTDKFWKLVFIALDEVAGGYFQVVHEIGNGSGWWNGGEEVDVVGHTIDPIHLALMVAAIAIDVGIEFTVVARGYGIGAFFYPPNDVVDEFCICHIVVNKRGPFQGPGVEWGSGMSVGAPRSARCTHGY